MIVIDPAFQPAFYRLGLATYEAITCYFGAVSLPPKNRTFVSLHSLSQPPDAGPVLDVYYKHYHYKSPAWSFIGRSSKPRREFENYEVFARLGLPTVQRVAFGEARDRLGRLRGAFIITRAIPEAMTLRELFQSRGPLLDRNTRLLLFRQLAAMTRRLHDAGFCHNDLVWRNLLVTRPAPDAPRLWWIDCPRGRFVHWPFSRRRKRIKDLASSYKSAQRFCHRTDQLRLILFYRGISKLDQATKTLIRDVLAFGRRRWPEDWDLKSLI